MKYREFTKKMQELGVYQIYDMEEYIRIDVKKSWPAFVEVSKTKPEHLFTQGIDKFIYKDLDMLRAAVELAETPLDERGR